MNKEIIKKLNLTRADFCLGESYQYLTLYHYKKGVYMAETNWFDGVANTIIVFERPDNYSAIPEDYILAMPISQIDMGLKIVG